MKIDLPTNRARKPVRQVSRPRGPGKASAQLEKIKKQLLVEYRLQMHRDKRMIDLALKEAEALAWQTGYPNLFFPVLAMEKAEAALAWNFRQQAVRQNPLEWSFAV